MKFEVTGNNWPRRKPLAKGAIVELTERAARHALIDGDIMPATNVKSDLGSKPAQTKKAGK